MPQTEFSRGLDGYEFAEKIAATVVPDPIKRIKSEKACTKDTPSLEKLLKSWQHRIPNLYDPAEQIHFFQVSLDLLKADGCCDRLIVGYVDSEHPGLFLITVINTMRLAEKLMCNQFVDEPRGYHFFWTTASFIRCSLPVSLEHQCLDRTDEEVLKNVYPNSGVHYLKTISLKGVDNS